MIIFLNSKYLNVSINSVVWYKITRNTKGYFTEFLSFESIKYVNNKCMTTPVRLFKEEKKKIEKKKDF